MEQRKPSSGNDAAQAVRFMLLKAAIFIGIPLAAALIAALTIILR